MVEALLRTSGVARQRTIGEITQAIRTIQARIETHGARPIFALWEPDPQLGWRCRANATVSLEHLPHYEAARVTTNRLGMVDAEPDARRQFVLVLGDSFVEGINVPHDQHFTHHLERSFPRFEFLNFGVSGYGSVQSYLHLQQRMRQFTPSHVIYSIYLGNDFDENDPLINNSMAAMPGYQRNAIPFLSAGDYIVYGDNSFRPFRYGLHESHAFLLLRDALHRAGLLEPYGVGVTKRVVQRLANDLALRKIPFSLLLIPDDASVHVTSAPRYEAIRALAHALDIPVISLLEPFRLTGRTTMGYRDERGQTIDPHWDSASHRLVAEVVADALPLPAAELTSR